MAPSRRRSRPMPANSSGFTGAVADTGRGTDGTSTRSGSSTSCAAPVTGCLSIPAPLGPFIGGVVMPNIAEHEARRGAMDDQADVVVDPHRPEIRVARPVEPMQAQTGRRSVQLQIERRGLDRLLLGAIEPREAGGEGIGDTEVHRS